ncbi:DUF4178 domain-containing protein [Amycolatopsis anabasis]|uniref:DUF4178 domain-containing protein n=1 Tax=Amycolatopsis anabasis TaxID=1840409 RepID=UPI00131D43EE|nr:DUF4178 domain-containing protein [Amycolatopsis anabasis]
MEREPRPTPPTAGAHGLRLRAGRFAPGTEFDIANRTWSIRGTVICTDPVETWLECYLAAATEHIWLAVEARDGADHCTLWHRTVVPGNRGLVPPVPAGADFREVERGSAEFSASGSFGLFEIPRSGSLDYLEFLGADGVRTAFERFAPALPWLVGSEAGGR